MVQVVQTVDEQLGLEVATLGWSCVWVFLAVSFLPFGILIFNSTLDIRASLPYSYHIPKYSTLHSKTLHTPSNYRSHGRALRRHGKSLSAIKLRSVS